MAGRICSVCKHEDRRIIDEQLLEGAIGLRALGRLHDLSHSALFRHKDRHLTRVMVKAHEAKEIAHGETLLEQADYLRERAMGILDEAEASGDLRGALLGIRECRSCLELLAKLSGELKERHVHEVADSQTAAAWMELTKVFEELKSEQHLMVGDITESSFVHEGPAALPALPPGYKQ